jgi:hypothetical protein
MTSGSNFSCRWLVGLVVEIGILLLFARVVWVTQQKLVWFANLSRRKTTARRAIATINCIEWHQHVSCSVPAHRHFCKQTFNKLTPAQRSCCSSTAPSFPKRLKNEALRSCWCQLPLAILCTGIGKSAPSAHVGHFS